MGILGKLNPLAGCIFSILSCVQDVVKAKQTFPAILLTMHLLHPAGTSIVSDICDLSNISDIAPLTLGSMEKSFFYHLFCVTQETYLSKDLWEIYI